MKIQLITPGKTTQQFISDGVLFYQKRIRQWARFEITETLRPKSGNLPEGTYRRKEEKDLLKNLPSQAFIVALDEKGVNFTSRELAIHLQKWMNNAPGGVSFVCGGAYGLGEEVMQRAGAVVALSKLTFPHQLVRLIFAEQVYRALSIIHNHPYHH